MSGKGEEGKWITVNGSHIFVEKGQDVEDAMEKHFDKNKVAKDYQDDMSHKYNKGDTFKTSDGEEWEVVGTKESTADYDTGRKGMSYKLRSKKTGQETDVPCWYAEKNYEWSSSSKADWSKVSNVNQALKIDPDFVEKKLASNIIFSSSDLNMTDEEVANRIDHMDISYIKHNVDKDKVKTFIKNNRANIKDKIFSSYREISENIK